MSDVQVSEGGVQAELHSYVHTFHSLGKNAFNTFVCSTFIYDV